MINGKSTGLMKRLKYILCRCVISHDTAQKCSKIKNKNAIKKGMVSQELFRELCEKGSIVSDIETLRNYMLVLDLAVHLEDGHLFIPALASDEEVDKCCKLLLTFFVFLIGTCRFFI